MNRLVLFVAISAVLINSAYGIRLRTKINAVTMKKAMIATTSDFQEHVGVCRTSWGGSGNPDKKNVEPEDCKKICLSDPGCTAIETKPGTTHCEIHNKQFITKVDATKGWKSKRRCFMKHGGKKTKAIAGSWNSVETYPNNNRKGACTCTCPNGESFSMVGWFDCENGHGRQSCWWDRHKNLNKVKCTATSEIIEELQKKNKDLTEEKNLLIKQKIKLKRKILDLAEASKPKDVFGMVCGPEQKRRQNACFKHLEKCGDKAILSWPIEWHQIHEHFDAKIHHLSNKNETHIGHPHLAKRRRLLEYSGVTDLIDLSKLEYVQSTETDTLYRFNCFGEDKHIRLCELMSETVETCDCSKRDSIPFRYEGEEVHNNNKYSNAVITGRLECENGAYAIHMEVDITENGVSLGRVDRRRRLLNSKRGRSRLLTSSRSQC
eukprot:g14564.t1